MIPFEIMSMGVSALAGFAFKMMAVHQENKREQFKMMMQQHAVIEDSRKEARKLQNPAAAFIRRFIVITMMSILAFLVVAPALDSTLTTNIVTEIEREGFLWWGGGKQIGVTVISGMMYDDTIRSILASIIGFYFGGATVQQR